MPCSPTVLARACKPSQLLKGLAEMRIFLRGSLVVGIILQIPTIVSTSSTKKGSNRRMTLYG